MNRAPLATDSARDPPQGITLEMMLTALVVHFGGSGLGRQIPMRCAFSDAGMSSNLKFLRTTSWVRTKVENR